MTYEEALKMSQSEQVKHRRTMRDHEHQLQVKCVKWFNYQYPNLRGLLFAIPNGGRRDETTAKKLKAEGVVAGVADLFLAIPRYKLGGSYTVHHGLFIEMKTEDKGSRQRPSQREFEGNVRMMRYDYHIVRTFDEFVELITSYLDYGKDEGQE